MPANNTKVKVTLTGLSDIMFDRYVSMEAKLTPKDKMYLFPGDKKGTVVVGLPVVNLFSFFTAQNTASAPKVLLDTKKYKEVARAFASNIEFPANPFIPFLRDGKPILFGEFEENQTQGADSITHCDKLSRCYVIRHTARLKEGRPNDKVRPVLPMPWDLKFELSVLSNEEFSLVDVKNMLENGGRYVSLGTFRPMYGRFALTEFACDGTAS